MCSLRSCSRKAAVAQAVGLKEAIREDPESQKLCHGANEAPQMSSALTPERFGGANADTSVEIAREDLDLNSFQVLFKSFSACCLCAILRSSQVRRHSPTQELSMEASGGTSCVRACSKTCNCGCQEPLVAVWLSCCGRKLRFLKLRSSS